MRQTAERHAPESTGRRTDPAPDTPTRALPSTTTGHAATSIAHGIRYPSAYVAVSSDCLSGLADAHVSGPGIASNNRA